MQLDVPELLINLILEYLAKEFYFMIGAVVLLDCSDDCRGPFYNKLF